MTKKPVKRQTRNDICTPIATYIVTRNGLRLPTGTTTADAMNDLIDMGAKLYLPHNPSETTIEYATRLRHALKPYDRHQYIEGTAVYMLRLILDLYAPPARKKQTANSKGDRHHQSTNACKSRSNPKKETK